MNSIYATFSDPGLAQKAAGALLDFGVLPEHITVVHDKNWVRTSSDEMVSEGGHDSNTETFRAEDGKMSDSEVTAKFGISTTTAADATAGAATGAEIGLGVGAAVALISIFVPGIGLVIGGGALAIALVGAAAVTGAGAIAGAVTGYLKDQGMQEEVAQEYSKAVDSGGAILTIDAPSNEIGEHQIRTILHKYGAMNVNSYVGVPKPSGEYVASL